MLINSIAPSVTVSHTSHVRRPRLVAYERTPQYVQYGRTARGLDRSKAYAAIAKYKALLLDVVAK